MPRLRSAALLVLFLCGLRLAGGSPEDEKKPPQAPPGVASNRLDEANRKAAEEVSKSLATDDAPLRARLQLFGEKDVVVVGGLFDFVQEILKAFRVPHRVVRCEELDLLPLNPERMVLLLNCHLLDRKFPAHNRNATKPTAREAEARLRQVLKEHNLGGDDAPGKAIRERFNEVKFFAGSDYSEGALRRLGAFVERGGWVMSTDWAILALERALKKRIRWTGRRTYEERVPARPATAAKKNPLLKGVFPAKGAPRWWLEQESYLFKVSGKAERLVQSRELAARYGGHRDLAVLLHVKKGRVLHVLSHFYLQRAKPGDAASMQRLLLNFLGQRAVEVNRREYERRKAEEKKKK